jgi:hypothetical protein
MGPLNGGAPRSRHPHHAFPPHRSYGPLRHPLVLGRFPGGAGYTADPSSRRCSPSSSISEGHRVSRPAHRWGGPAVKGRRDSLGEPSLSPASATGIIRASASGGGVSQPRCCVLLLCHPRGCSSSRRWADHLDWLALSSEPALFTRALIKRLYQLGEGSRARRDGHRSTSSKPRSRE